MRVSHGYATAHLGDGSGGRPHVFPVDENVHGVVAAPLHAHAVPDLSSTIKVHVCDERVSKAAAVHRPVRQRCYFTLDRSRSNVGGSRSPAHREPVQRAAVILPLQRAVTLHLGAAEQPGDLGAELREGGRETRQRAGRQLQGRQRGQADVQRAAPLLVHLIDPDLQWNGDGWGWGHQGRSRNKQRYRFPRFLPQTARPFSAPWR